MQTAFDYCQQIEAEGMKHIIPFLQEHAAEGRFVLTGKGPLSKYFQAHYGDIVFNGHNGKMYLVEVKTETKATGNFFIETWSNKPVNRGWLFKISADYILYYFQDTEALYSIDVGKLTDWVFSVNGMKFWGYQEVPQRKYKQANETCGKLVPIQDLIDLGIAKKHTNALSSL